MSFFATNAENAAFDDCLRAKRRNKETAESLDKFLTIDTINYLVITFMTDFQKRFPVHQHVPGTPAAEGENKPDTLKPSVWLFDLEKPLTTDPIRELVISLGFREYGLVECNGVIKNTSCTYWYRIEKIEGSYEDKLTIYTSLELLLKDIRAGRFD